MPPKAKSAERLQQEAAAQRARAAALQHLAKTGAGPSQKEIAQQQKDREKWSNATTQAVQQRLAKGQPPATAPGAPMRDNTLAAVAAQRARLMLQGGGGDGVVSGSSGAFGGACGGYDAMNTRSFGAEDAGDALPDGWKPAVDPVSGDTYYWNETTKETSWKRPKRKAPLENDKAEPDEEDELEDGWEEVTDPQSGQTYYWHRDSNETTWTKPVKKTVSLEQAREAKSRLDAILKLCGPSKKPTSLQSTKQSIPVVSTTPAQRKRDADSHSDGPEMAKKARVDA